VVYIEDQINLNMPKGAKRGREEVEDYESDGGFVANDEEDAVPKKKTSAKAKDDGDEKYWEVSVYRFNVSFL
jgi:hypothetical protein